MLSLGPSRKSTTKPGVSRKPLCGSAKYFNTRVLKMSTSLICNSLPLSP